MAKNKKKKNKNKTKKLHFSDYKVTFLNHASYSIETKDELLLMDPWFFGRVFNNSWSLMRETQTDKIDFNKLKYICFSHEHPDHLHWPTLKFIREKCKQPITILFPSRDNENVKQNCERLGFLFRELKHNQPTKIGKFTTIFTYPVGHDNALVFKLGSKTLLNQNDAYLKDSQAIEIKKKHPNIDAWFMQFSLAGFYANKTDEKGLQKDGKDFHINKFEHYQNIFKPKTSIPFASFVYFCKKYNSYMNDWIVTLDEIKEVSQHPLQILFYGDEMSWEYEGDNKDKISLWSDVFQNETTIDDDPKKVSESTILELTEKLMDIVAKDTEVYVHQTKSYIKLHQVAPNPIYLKFYDHERYFGIDFKGLRYGFFDSIDNDRLAGILPLEEFESFLKFDWGADTLNVTAAFEVINGAVWSNLLIYRDFLYERIDFKKLEGQV